MAVISERLGFHFTYARLRNTYRRMGIKYKAVEHVSIAANTTALHRERIAFAKEITSLLIQGKPIWFVDESSTKVWEG